MKRRFTEEQIIGVLREQEAGGTGPGSLAARAGTSRHGPGPYLGPRHPRGGAATHPSVSQIARPRWRTAGCQ